MVAEPRTPTATGRTPAFSRASAESPVRAAQPKIESTPARLGGLGAGQIMLWQIVVAGILFAAVRQDWTIVPAGTLAIIVMVLTIFRAHGRWLYQDIGVRARFRARRRIRPPATPGDPRLAPLRTLLPELEITAISGRHGQTVGVAYDGRAWSGTVELLADELSPGRQPATTLPVHRLHEVLQVDDIRPASVQVLCDLVPAPPGEAAAAPVYASYRQLNTRHAPGAQRVWVAVRADPESCAEAIEARGGGADGARRVVKRCVARVIELLEAENIHGRPLDADALRTALAVSSGARHPSTAPGAAGAVEGWTHWYVDGSAHVTWWVRAWPATGAQLQPLREAALAASARSCCLSLTLHAARGRDARLRALVRLSATTPDGMKNAAAAFERQARSRGYGMVRLDGEQGLGLVATLPLGGGLA